ncbi:MAG: hypothetical protein ACRDKT_12775 [Actinomycetota bacterium]
MARFVPGVAIVTDKPVVTVEKLEPGEHVFSLVVVDDAGNESEPDLVRVTVKDPAAPR